MNALHLLLTSWLALTAAPLAATAGPARHPMAEWLDFVRSEKHSPRAAIGLWSLASLEGLAGDLERAALRKLREDLVGDRKTPLGVRRLARAQLATMAAAAGQAARASELQAAQGWLRDWWVIGPFDNEARGGPDQATDLETGPFSQQTWPSKWGPVSWRAYPDRPQDGRIRLHPLFLPRDGIHAFAFTEFELQRAQTLLFHLGCDDGCKLWINGQAIGVDPGPHSWGLDQRTWSVKLARGQHRLLVKISQDVSEMGFSLALTDDQGRPPRDLHMLHSDVGSALPSSAPADLPKPLSIKARPSLGDWFQKQVAGHPADPQRMAEAAWALYQTAQADRRSRQAEQLIEQALKLAPADDQARLGWFLWMARMAEDDNRSREWLEQAIEAFPGQAAAHARLGLIHQVRGETSRAFAAYQKALAIDPRHLPSQVGLAELHSDLGLFAQAEARMRVLLKQHSDVPEVLIAAGLLFRKHGDRQQARDLFTALIQLDAHEQLGLRALFEMAAARGDLPAALGFLDRLQAIDPLRQNWWQQRSALLMAHGRGAEALAAITRASAICPADPQPALAEGEILLQQGRDAEAVEAMERALTLAPQDHQLQRRIRALAPRGQPFYTNWQQDAASWIGRPPSASSNPAAGAQRLLDLHVVLLHPNGMASHFRQQLVRILAERGAQRFRTFQVEYAPGRQDVRVLTNRVWRRDGSRDTGVLVDDVSLSEPWYNLYYDVRARQITFPELRPGDVVEVTTLVQDVGDAALLGEYFGDLVSIQTAEPLDSFRYVLIDAGGQPLSFYSPLDGLKHRVEEDEQGRRNHIWQAEGLPAVESEANMPGFTETHGYLHLSTFPDWKRLGAWFYARIKDQLMDGPDIGRLARELTAGMSEPREKIRAIYRFVADSTRYVGLEFGIHSYVPYRASQVLQRRYGDCKDKSALLVALLAEVGIEARLALVRMRRLGRFDPSGANTAKPPASLAMFNHAIVYLPEQDLWLDGTAALHDVDDLPGQDQGAQALLIEPAGGRLRETPSNGPERNWTSLSFQLAPEPDGRADLKVQLAVSGTLAPEMRMRFHGGKPAEQTFESIIEELFAGAQVRRAELQNLAEPKEPLRIDAEVSLPKLGKMRDQGLELAALGKTTGYQRMLATEQRRAQDLVIGPGWAVSWRVAITPPQGFSLSGLPEAGEVKNDFGTARFSTRQEGQSLVSEAVFRLTAKRIPVADYPAFRRFLGQVDHLLSQHISLTGASDVD